MNTLINTLKLCSLAVLLLSTAALAQSAGGGLGGDRGQRFAVESARPIVLNHEQMNCSELIRQIQVWGKARLNFPGLNMSTYKIVFPIQSSLHCSSPHDLHNIYVKTLDSESCLAGYTCF